MYVSGIVITPLTSTATPISLNVNSPVCNATGDSPCRRAHIILKKTFNLGQGNAVGPLYWSSHAGGNFNAPDFTENTVQDRMIITGKACWSTLTCDVNAGFDTPRGDTTAIVTPITNGSQGGININTAVTRVGTTNCSTSGGRCQQTVQLDYELTVRGFDKMNLTDSVSGCGGTCEEASAHHYYGEHESDLIACGDEITPGTLIYQCTQQLAGDSNMDNESNIATGGVPAEVCGEACIVIYVRGTPPHRAAGAGPFHFVATGLGVCQPDCEFDVTLLLNPAGEQVVVLKNLQPDPPAGNRTVTITDFPPGGAQGDFQLDSVECTGAGTCKVIHAGTKNKKTKIGFEVTTLSGQLIAELHMH
jgi:hypothetical protein